MSTLSAPARRTSGMTKGPTTFPTALSVAAVVAALGLAFIVGRDGSAPWQVARVVVVAAATALVVAGLRSDRARGRAALAFVAGLVVLPVGIGIGPRYLTETGLTAMS